MVAILTHYICKYGQESLIGEKNTRSISKKSLTRTFHWCDPPPYLVVMKAAPLSAAAINCDRQKRSQKFALRSSPIPKWQRLLKISKAKWHRHWNIQSSKTTLRITINFVYRRRKIAIVENDVHVDMVSITTESMFGGLTKLYLTPGGGVKAGPLSMTCSPAVGAIRSMPFVLWRRIDPKKKKKKTRRNPSPKRWLGKYITEGTRMKFETKTGDKGTKA